MEIASATHAWDGGLVEISLEGSDTWTVINPLGGYPYLVEPNEDSPFDANTPVFSGSVNWELAEFDLADYAGQIVRVRFRFGSDAAVTEEGWYIDDVSLSGIGVDWLSIDPTSGTVLPDGSQTLTLSVDATDQEPGALEAVLLFVSDAVNAPSLAVPRESGGGHDRSHQRSAYHAGYTNAAASVVGTERGAELPHSAVQRALRHLQHCGHHD